MEKLLLPLLVVVVIGVFVALWVFVKKRSGADYDERQITARNRAYKTAFFSAMLYMIVCGLLAQNEVYWAKFFVQMFLGVILTIAVFALSAIRNDALLTVNNGGIYSIVLCFFVAVMDIVSAVKEIIGGKKIIEAGMLTDLAIPFVVAFSFLAVAVALVVKKIMNKRSEEM